MSVSFFRQHLKASPLPLSQAAPGFLSVGPGGWPTDGPTTAHQQKKKKTPCEEKVYNKGHGKQSREGENSFGRLTGTGSAFLYHGSAESEWTERERSTNGTSPPSVYRLCLSVSRLGGDSRGLTGGNLWGEGRCHVKRLLTRVQTLVEADN